MRRRVINPEAEIMQPCNADMQRENEENKRAYALLNAYPTVTGSEDADRLPRYGCALMNPHGGVTVVTDLDIDFHLCHKQGFKFTVQILMRLLRA